MQFRVIKPFRDPDGPVRMPGQTVDMAPDRAARLRRMGLIGQMSIERAVMSAPEREVQPEREQATVAPSETAVETKSPAKRRKRKTKAEKE